MIVELAILAYLAIVGGLFLATFAPGTSPVWTSATAIPVGIVVAGSSLGVTALVAQISDQAGLVLLAGALVGLQALVLAVRRKTKFGRAALLLLWSATPLLPVALLRAAWDPTFILGDTMIQSALVQRILADGWASVVDGQLANWSMIYLMLSLFGASFGLLFISTLGYVAAVCLLLASLAMTLDTPLGRGWTRLAAGSFLAATWSAAAGCFYLLMILSFGTSNVLMALFCGVFTALLLGASLAGGPDSDKASWRAPVLAVMLAGVALSRIEGVIYGSIFLAWFAGSGIFQLEAPRRFLIGASVLVSAVYVAIWLTLGREHGAMISSSQFAVLSAIALAWIAFVFVARSVPDLIAASLQIGAIVLLIGVFVLSSRVPDLELTLLAMLGNVFGMDLWGAFPLVVVVVLPAIALATRNRAVLLGIAALCITLAVVLLLPLMRAPYYVDVADSGHRLFGSLIPLMLSLLLGGMLSLLNPRHQPA